MKSDRITHYNRFRGVFTFTQTNNHKNEQLDKEENLFAQFISGGIVMVLLFFFLHGAMLISQTFSKGIQSIPFNLSGVSIHSLAPVALEHSDFLEGTSSSFVISNDYSSSLHDYLSVKIDGPSCFSYLAIATWVSSVAEKIYLTFVPKIFGISILQSRAGPPQVTMYTTSLDLLPLSISSLNLFSIIKTHHLFFDPSKRNFKLRGMYV